MAVLAPLVALLLGVAFAWAAWAELARDDGPLVASRPFAIVVAFTVLVFTPIGTSVHIHEASTVRLRLTRSHARQALAVGS